MEETQTETNLQNKDRKKGSRFDRTKNLLIVRTKVMDRDKENILTATQIKTWKRDIDRDRTKTSRFRADLKLTDGQNKVMDRDKEEILTAIEIKTWKRNRDRDRNKDRKKQADSIGPKTY